MVSPSRPQLEVEAVAANESAPALSTFKYDLVPFDRFKEILPLMVKRPEEDSGPSIGTPPVPREDD